MTNRNTNKIINFLCVILAGLSFYIHFFSNLDVSVQKIFYIDGGWLIHPQDPIFYFLFYDLPKVIVILLGVYCLSLLGLGLRSGQLDRLKKVGLITVLASFILFPTLINLLKDLLRQPCPRDLVIFGGPVDLGMLEYLTSRGPIKCFPGAHASVPFSLLSVVYLFKDKYNRALFLMSVLPTAFFISMYQVLRGVHFITDTTFTAALSWLFIQWMHNLTTRFFPGPTS